MTIYPTDAHAHAADAIAEFFRDGAAVDSVLLMGSCARGKASRDSCLDILVLVPPHVASDERAGLEQAWNTFYESAPVFKTLRQVGKYSHVDLELIDGCFAPPPHGWTTGPDAFELEIGNTLTYSMPLWERGGYYAHLRAQWLPYYDEALREQRLDMVLRYCLNNLDHIPLYIDRDLYFQSFNRLYDALGEFLQALFIARRIYPIAYDKWIREQVEEILGLPDLYPRLPRLLEIEHFESTQIAVKAEDLRELVNQYIRP